MDQPSILVVEDDYQLQGIASARGIPRQHRGDAEEALTLFTGNPGAHRALVADINLRGRLSGWDAARRLREIVPYLPVPYMTGAAGEQWPSQRVPGSILAKPFAPAQQVAAVSQLLIVRDTHHAGGPR
ncbi:response regulator transcription factor [Bradyrhizobium sp. LCT2]|nr:response regulator transcription factor [Bradyrhizobium sp. LCT2]